jgi:hypothetical protein
VMWTNHSALGHVCKPEKPIFTDIVKEKEQRVKA